MYSIGQISKEFHLSRSTLLYYDSIGLLSASGRTSSNYRQYSREDRQRLIRICAFREAGVPLQKIKEILISDGDRERNILENRLAELNRNIRLLRFQQQLIVSMLKDEAKSRLFVDKQTFVSVLQSAGLDDDTMQKMHIQFEQNSPGAHQAFLEFLGFSDAEIEMIRCQCEQNQ